MSKTLVAIISFSAFATGLFIGGFGALLYLGGLFGESLATVKQLQFAEIDNFALDAYQTQSPLVGIFALSRYLDKLNETEDLISGGVGLVPQEHIDFCRTVAHGRLAKLHLAVGNQDEAADNVDKAIKLAGKLELPVSDEDSLMEFIERADRLELSKLGLQKQ